MTADDVERLILSARDLRSVDDDNPEYDKALVELIRSLLRVPPEADGLIRMAVGIA